MTRYRFGLTTIGFYLILILTAIFVEGINPVGFSIGDYSWMEMVLISVAIIFTTLFYYIVEKKNNKCKVSWILLPILTILLILGLQGIWRVGNGTYHVGTLSYTMDIPVIDRVKWTLSLLFSLSAVYFTINYFSRHIIQVKRLRIVIIGLSIFTVGAIIYSLVYEMPSYKGIFAPDAPDAVKEFVSIKSLFNNENTYAQLLFLAILMIILLNAIKPHWWHFFYILIFYIAMIFSTSFIGLVSSLFMIVIYYIYKFIVTMKKHPIRNAIVLSITLFVLICLIGSFFTMYYYGVTPIVKLFDYVLQMILDKDFATGTGRTTVWHDSLMVFQTPYDWVFGVGYQNFNHLFGQYRLALKGYYGISVDSAYVQVMGSFGLIGLLTYIFAIVYFFYICIVCIKSKKCPTAATCLILGLTYFLYGFGETAVIFNGDLVGLLGFFSFVTPIAIEYNKVRKTKYVEEAMNDHSFKIWPKEITAPMVAQAAGFVITIPICVSLLSMIFMPSPKAVVKGPLVSLIFFICLFISLPVMIALWHTHPNRKLRLARYISLPLLMFIAPLIVFLSMYWVVPDPMLTIAMTLLTFIIVYTLILIFTIIGQSHDNQALELLFKYTLKPNLLPMLYFLIVSVPIGFLLHFIFNLSHLSMAVYMLIMAIAYFISPYIMPNFKGCRKDALYILEQSNVHYLYKQRMYFEKIHKKETEERLAIF